MVPPTLLLVDDEDHLRCMLEAALRHHGFDVLAVDDGRSALTVVRDFAPDLVVLDVMMPDLDGFEVCRRLRADRVRTPIVFLTARDDTEEKVRGLTIGGDDYVVKPFSIEELVARINVVLRRTGSVAMLPSELRCGDLVLDEDAHRVTVAGEEVGLSPTEFNLLRFLMLNEGRVVSKAQIVDDVWTFDFEGDPRIVETYIGYLRRKIDRGQPKFIRTVRGVGYMLKLGASGAVKLKSRVLVAVAAIGCVLISAGVVITRTTTDYLVGQLDSQLSRFASRVEGMPPVPPLATGEVAVGTGVQLPALTPRQRDSSFSTLYLGVFDGGELTTAVRPARGDSSRAIPRLSRAEALELAAHGGYASVGSTRDGTRYRVTARRAVNGDLTVLAVQLNDVDAAVSRLVTVATIAGLLIVVVLGLITWWVLRLGVRPVERMTAAAAAVAAGDLERRIPDAPDRTEAAALGTALNAMLQRMRDLLDERAVSEQRLRRFLADASHELRTPVTTIRGYAELYRSGGLEDRAQRDAALARTEAEAIRLSRLVEDMTTLARLDERIARTPHDVSLDDLVEGVAADFRVTHPDRSVTISSDDLSVLGDADQLHQVLANLLDNVALHTPADTPVEIALRADGPWVQLQVIDHGPGVAEEVAARAFERFYRADPSRSRSSGGSGLGLSIVAAIVDAHGGFVEMHGRPADDPLGHGTTVTVELPVNRVLDAVQR